MKKSFIKQHIDRSTILLFVIASIMQFVIVGYTMYPGTGSADQTVEVSETVSGKENAKEEQSKPVHNNFLSTAIDNSTTCQTMLPITSKIVSGLATYQVDNAQQTVSAIVDIVTIPIASKEEVKVTSEKEDLLIAALERKRQEAIAEEEAKRLAAEEAAKVKPLLPPTKLSRKTDLAVFNVITAEQMNDIINKFNKPNSPFTGRGDVFIKASEASGLNPLYIFGHASYETGYGTSAMARKKHNYFGINACDSNPSNAYAMGDGLEQGIINGAIWIREHYYDKGLTSLHGMIHDTKYPYASARDTWINNIVSIANVHAD